MFGLQESTNINYLLAILNSKLFVFIYRLLSLEKGRVLAQVKPTTLAQLPIYSINFSNVDDKARHEQIIQHAEFMMALHKLMAVTHTQAEQEQIQRQIDTTNRKIDEIVYKLYNLTSDEIDIVNSQT